jgi:hypothetical protein
VLGMLRHLHLLVSLLLYATVVPLFWHKEGMDPPCVASLCLLN